MDKVEKISILWILFQEMGFVVRLGEVAITGIL